MTSEGVIQLRRHKKATQKLNQNNVKSSRTEPPIAPNMPHRRPASTPPPPLLPLVDNTLQYTHLWSTSSLETKLLAYSFSKRAAMDGDSPLGPACRDGHAMLPRTRVVSVQEYTRRWYYRQCCWPSRPQGIVREQPTIHYGYIINTPAS